jgi:hypothetical protein
MLEGVIEWFLTATSTLGSTILASSMRLRN